MATRGEHHYLLGNNPWEPTDGSYPVDLADDEEVIHTGEMQDIRKKADNPRAAFSKNMVGIGKAGRVASSAISEVYGRIIQDTTLDMGKLFPIVPVTREPITFSYRTGSRPRLDT